MARPKLRSADQPLPLQVILGLYEFFASLKLAVILILLAALSLAYATFVESAYGTPAVQFGVYGTWWFTLINALLAVNIFCAAAIRYPWKRHQTGFVITHIGLLVLLFGCLLSRRGGIDAQMPVFEDSVAHRAFEDSHHLQLTLSKSGAEDRTLNIPLTTGPFNWADYGRKLSQPLVESTNSGPLGRTARRAFALVSGGIFQLASRDRGVIFDQDGVKIELLDFYSDSTDADAPSVKLQISSPRMPKMGADGKPATAPQSWMPVELTVKNLDRMHLKDSPFRYGFGDQQRVGGGAMTFWLTGSDAEVQAFLEAAPEGSLGEKGQIVLWIDGQARRMSVDEYLGKGKFAIDGTGLEAEIVNHAPKAALTPAGERTLKLSAAQTENDWGPGVELNLFRKGEAAGRLVLFADMPQLSLQNYDQKIFGHYWFDHGEKSTAELMQGGGGSRMDVVQGPDQKLYYRYWNRKEVVKAAELPSDGTRVDAFKMPIGQLKMYVDRFVPSSSPEKQILPLPFKKEKAAIQKLVAAQLKVTVDDKTEEFWLQGIPGGDPTDPPPTSLQKREVASSERSLKVMLPPDEIDVGFRVRLKDFERKLDPGTSQASHYSSFVDLVDRTHDRDFQKDVLITMNAPVDFSDPTTGHSYRLFQESFAGPWSPGEQVYDLHADPSRDELYMSTLTVNYDPGRGTKYAGCLLIVFGIGTMFYMRAYFFKPRPRPSASPAVGTKQQPVRQPSMA